VKRLRNKCNKFALTICEHLSI